jgi:CHAT domain-containing protein
VLPEAKLESQFLKKQFDATEMKPESGEVRKLISQPGAFDLLHFACHGEADSNTIAHARLLLEGRMEGGQYVEDTLSAVVVEQFADLVAPDGNKPVVVLNACQAGRLGYQLTGSGGFAQAFLKGGAGAFVATLWAIGDGPARTFTETFYQELLNGSTVAEAANRARSAAEAAKDATWLAYAVYGHPHAKVTR